MTGRPIAELRFRPDPRRSPGRACCEVVYIFRFCLSTSSSRIKTGSVNVSSFMRLLPRFGSCYAPLDVVERFAFLPNQDFVNSPRVAESRPRERRHRSAYDYEPFDATPFRKDH